ncbi:MAG: NAD-binding protein [candidate division KSB1 bacterium]|nr:NAD-binding protein [candidate division KSB1 bacterium]MDZ7393334.1 NAD-binding protein [candidate division KSB1 bacterium]
MLTRRRVRHIFYGLRRRLTIKVVILVVGIALAGGVLGLLAERGRNSGLSTLEDAMWWTVVTMMTVGYGDRVPITPLGRLVGVMVMFSGVAVISLLTGGISSALVTRRLKEAKGLQRIRARNHLLICGWSRHVEELLQRLREDLIAHGRTVVLVNELQEEEVENLLFRHRDLVIKFVRGDFAEETILRRANVEAAYAAVLVPDTLSGARGSPDEHTILATLTIKALAPHVKVLAYIVDAQNEAHLRRANADRIVVGDAHGGFFLAAHVASPGVPEMLEALLAERAGMKLMRQSVPSAFVGRTFGEFARHMRQSKQTLLLGFIREEQRLKLEEVLTGDYSAIDDFIRRKLEAAGKGLGAAPRVEVNLNPPDSYVIQERDVAVTITPIQEG